MATTSSLDASQLLLFWKSRQLAIQVASAGTNYKLQDAYVLRRVQSGVEVTHYVGLWITGSYPNYTLNVADVQSVPDDYNAGITYNFSDDAGSIWLEKPAGSSSPAFVIIGTGDIRDLTAAGAVHKFELGTSQSSAVILSCSVNYKLDVYYKTTKSDVTVPYTIVRN